jgi:hypothetical protein
MFAGAAALWQQHSTNQPAVLGRYTPRFFLFLVAYHVGMLAWFLLIVFFLGCSINDNRRTSIQAWVSRFVRSRWKFLLALAGLVLPVGLYSGLVLSTGWADDAREVLVSPAATVALLVIVCIFAANDRFVQPVRRLFLALRSPLFSWILAASALLLLVYNLSSPGSSRSVLIMLIVLFVLLFTLVFNEVPLPFGRWVPGLMGVAGLPVLFLLWGAQPFDLKELDPALVYVTGFLLAYGFLLMLSAPAQLGRWTFTMALVLCAVYSVQSVIYRTIHEGYPLTPFATDLVVPSSTDLVVLQRQEGDNLEVYLYFFENYRGETMQISASSELPFRRSHMKYWGGVAIQAGDYDPVLSTDEANTLLGYPHDEVILDNKPFVFVDTPAVDDGLSLYQYAGEFFVLR